MTRDLVIIPAETLATWGRMIENDGFSVDEIISLIQDAYGIGKEEADAALTLSIDLAQMVNCH